MNILTQTALILAVCLCGEMIAAVLPFAFPASVVSMILLLLLLVSGAVKTRQIGGVADFLLSNMAVMFVPAGVSVMKYWDVLSSNLLPIILICLISTPIVFAVTAYTVALTMRLTGGRNDV